MMTGNRARFRWRSLAASCVFGCCGWLGEAAAYPSGDAPVGAAADRPDVAGTHAPEDELLYLEVVVNRVTLAGVYPFTRWGGRMLATPETLREIGLAIPMPPDERGLLPLDELPGAVIDYDALEQRLLLDVPVSLLGAPPAQLGYTPPPAPRQAPESRAPGLLLDYDLYGESASGYRTLSAWSEFRLFGVGGGLWRSSAVSRFGSDAVSGQKAGTIRLDSNFTLDFPERMIRVSVGDDFTSGLAWTRVTRLGGIRVSRDFDLQPYRVTMPLARFEGETVLPSTADLFIEGIQQPRLPVAPGRFEVQSLPVLSGAGVAQVVLTDITGQQRTLNFSFYSSPDLLQKGLTDWSVEAGYLREDYGLASFAYADAPFFSGSLRVGASDAITFESHLESTRDLVMAGAGAMSRVPGIGGVLQGSYAESRHRGNRGHQYGFGYQWQGPYVSASYSSLHRDTAFRDVASLQKSLLPRQTDQAFVGLSLGRSQLGASYVRQDLPIFGSVRYASLSASVKFPRWGSLSLNLSRNLEAEGKAIDAYLYWSTEFGERGHAWASTERSDGKSTTTAGAGRALPGDENGFGWRLQASAGEQVGWQGEVGQLASFGQWRVGALRWRTDDARSTATYADASGALLLMEGQLLAMRRVYDAFALVSTDGVAGVPVMLENRHVGETNRKGYLLVTPLNAWQNNDVSIDPLVVPPDVTLARTRLDAVPTTGSGVLARFPMKKVLAVAFSLRRSDGGGIEAGTVARIQGGATSIDVVVGYDGGVFVEDPPAGAQVVVPLDEAQCAATLPAVLPESGWLDLGELPCMPQ